MKRIIFTASLAGLALLNYGLFKNVFDWNFGWQQLPPSTFGIASKGVENRFYHEEIGQSRIWLNQVHEETETPAISIAVSIKNEIVWSEAVGYMNVEKTIQADTSTLFRIGSTSKALTSLALGNLIDTGEIHPDSTVQHYTNAFHHTPEITIRQLASHQSGIRNYGLCFCFPIWEYYRNKSFSNVKESLSDFEKNPLLFKPGERFAYSTYNFTALSYAMEEASNTRFIDLMRIRVFRPLLMQYTFPDRKEKKYPNRSIFYDVDEGYYKRAPQVNLSNKWAGGGFLSTPSDLVRAGNALLTEHLLTDATIQLITEPQKLNDGQVNSQYYAFGWRHNISDMFFDGSQDIEIIHHGGMAVGAQSLLIVFPEHEMVISLLMNKTGQQGRFELFNYLAPIAEIFIQSIQREND